MDGWQKIYHFLYPWSGEGKKAEVGLWLHYLRKTQTGRQWIFTVATPQCVIVDISSIWSFMLDQKVRFPSMYISFQILFSSKHKDEYYKINSNCNRYFLTRQHFQTLKGISPSNVFWCDKILAEWKSIT